MLLSTAVLNAIEEDLEETVRLYKEFHRNPELSMQETNTADRIAEYLSDLGLETHRFGGTGVVVEIDNGPGPVVAYRADIDGLPIQEETGLDYASAARGVLPDGAETAVMHGCGHDAHIVVGLNLAKQLTRHPSLWAGTVVILFQPGEETAQGARAMLDDGLWKKISKPEAIYGQHVWPGLAGSVNVSIGTAMAMADSIEVTVRGKQAHGSQPENAIDPIVLGAFMITRLQTVVSREVSGQDMAVVTVGTFSGGLKDNIIPDSATFQLNIRTFDEDVRASVLSAIHRIIKAEAEASDAPEPIIREMYAFPRCFNDEYLASQLIETFQNELGEDNVNVTAPVTGSEDFGRFGDEIGVPYVYWFFGGHSEEQFVDGAMPPGNHSPLFGPDAVREMLLTGIRTGLSALLGHVATRKPEI